MLKILPAVKEVRRDKYNETPEWCQIVRGAGVLDRWRYAAASALLSAESVSQAESVLQYFLDNTNRHSDHKLKDIDVVFNQLLKEAPASKLKWIAIAIMNSAALDRAPSFKERVLERSINQLYILGQVRVARELSERLRSRAIGTGVMMSEEIWILDQLSREQFLERIVDLNIATVQSCSRRQTKASAKKWFIRLFDKSKQDDKTMAKRCKVLNQLLDNGGEGLLSEYIERLAFDGSLNKDDSRASEIQASIISRMYFVDRDASQNKLAISFAFSNKVNPRDPKIAKIQSSIIRDHVNKKYYRKAVGLICSKWIDSGMAGIRREQRYCAEKIPRQYYEAEAGLSALVIQSAARV